MSELNPELETSDHRELPETGYWVVEGSGAVCLEIPGGQFLAYFESPSAARLRIDLDPMVSAGFAVQTVTLDHLTKWVTTHPDPDIVGVMFIDDDLGEWCRRLK